MVRVPYSPPIEETVTHEVTVFFCVYTTDGEKNVICFIDYMVLLINDVYLNIKYIVWLFGYSDVTLQKNY